ncbi:MAG: PrsW family glutamic-type intramembrane protease [Bacteroidota bacterium]
MISLITILAAVVPGLLICYFIFRQDKHEREPIPLLVVSFVLGLIIYFIARYFEGLLDDFISPYVEANNWDRSRHLGVLFFSAFIRTAFVEEVLKFIFLLAIPFQNKNFNEPMDGIVYTVMIGMGFAVLENLVYCLPDDYALALVRDFTAVPSHAVFAVILGYYVGLAKFMPDKKRKIKYILFGLFLAVGVHGLYDIFLFQEFEDWLMILATLVLLGGLFFSRRFIDRHQKDSFLRQRSSTTGVALLGSQITTGNIATSVSIKEEDNEILAAVFYEMKEQQEATQKTREEEE